MENINVENIKESLNTLKSICTKHNVCKYGKCPLADNNDKCIIKQAEGVSLRWKYLIGEMK